MTLGRCTAGSTLCSFNGLIDEVQIYNRQLTNAEIRLIVDSGTQGVCKHCTDLDGDGYGGPGDTCPNGTLQDCADNDPTVWELPGEATDLLAATIAVPAGSALLTWQPPATSGTSAALAYDVIGSGNPADFVGGAAVCSLINTGTQAVASPTPALGAAFYYLVRAQNGCGGGIAGTSSSGVPIAARACP
jgi:hypothetical protein